MQHSPFSSKLIVLETFCCKMDSIQLRKILSSDKHIQHHKGSVVAIDELTNFNSHLLKFHYFIVNNQTRNLSGQHWFAIFFPGDILAPVEVFDSLGKSPASYNPILTVFLQTQRTQYCYNSLRVQSEQSVACGAFCLYFISMRCIGKSFESIVQTFHPTKYELNESLVKMYTGLRL